MASRVRREWIGEAANEPTPLFRGTVIPAGAEPRADRLSKAITELAAGAAKVRQETPRRQAGEHRRRTDQKLTRSDGLDHHPQPSWRVRPLPCGESRSVGDQWLGHHPHVPER